MKIRNDGRRYGLAALGFHWLVAALIGRISSLSALISALSVPVWAAVLDASQITAGALVMVALIFLRHRDNIRRLAAGTEPKIGQGKKAS